MLDLAHNQLKGKYQGLANLHQWSSWIPLIACLGYWLLCLGLGLVRAPGPARACLGQQPAWARGQSRLTWAAFIITVTYRRTNSAFTAAFYFQAIRFQLKWYIVHTKVRSTLRKRDPDHILAVTGLTCCIHTLDASTSHLLTQHLCWSYLVHLLVDLTAQVISASWLI